MTHDPNVIDRVRKMKRERKHDAEIAMSVGITEDSLKWLCHKHRIRRPRPDTVTIGLRLTERYRAEGVKRGMKYEPFVHKLLLIIERDNLFTAILDDDGK